MSPCLMTLPTGIQAPWNANPSPKRPPRHACGRAGGPRLQRSLGRLGRPCREPVRPSTIRGERWSAVPCPCGELADDLRTGGLVITGALIARLLPARGADI